jgi:hypothetical protein
MVYTIAQFSPGQMFPAAGFRRALNVCELVEGHEESPVAQATRLEWLLFAAILLGCGGATAKAGWAIGRHEPPNLDHLLWLFGLLDRLAGGVRVGVRDVFDLGALWICATLRRARTDIDAVAPQSMKCQVRHRGSDR